MKKAILSITATVCLFGLFFALRPVPVHQDVSRMITATGQVASVNDGGSFDVVIRLEEHDRTFYINRGLENGLELEQLKRDVVGKNVSVQYPRYWTLLDPMSQTRHVVSLKIDDEVIYNELACNEQN